MGPRHRFWVSHLQRIDSEGISIAAYARREQLSVYSLYNTRHNLKKMQKRTATRKQASAASAAQPFVAVKLPAQQAADTTCLLKLNGIELKLSALPDTNWLASLSLALERERR